MGIEEDITNKIAQEMADQIDFNIIAGILEKVGWTKVEFDTLGSNKQAIDMRIWCTKELDHDDVYHQGRTWLFKRQEDAILFKLTWS